MNGNRFICILYKFFVSNDSRFLITQDSTHTLYGSTLNDFSTIFFCLSSFAVHCVFRTERQLMLNWYCCCCCRCCSLLLLLLLLFVSFGVFFLSAVEEKKLLPNHGRRHRQRLYIYSLTHTQTYSQRLR